MHILQQQRNGARVGMVMQRHVAKRIDAAAFVGRHRVLGRVKIEPGRTAVQCAKAIVHGARDPLIRHAQGTKDHRHGFRRQLGEALESAPDLGDYEVELREDGELEVAIHADQTLNGLFDQLSARGIAVVSLRNKANRLEELFMGLVENKPDAA